MAHLRFRSIPSEPYSATTATLDEFWFTDDPFGMHADTCETEGLSRFQEKAGQDIHHSPSSPQKITVIYLRAFPNRTSLCVRVNCSWSVAFVTGAGLQLGNIEIWDAFHIFKLYKFRSFHSTLSQFLSAQATWNTSSPTELIKKKFSWWYEEGTPQNPKRRLKKVQSDQSVCCCKIFQRSKTDTYHFNELSSTDFCVNFHAFKAIKLPVKNFIIQSNLALA